MTPREQVHEIDIDASADAVWEAITDAEALTRWYVEAARVTPGQGGTQWVSWGQGVEMETTHRVWEPGRRLVLGAADGVPEEGWNAVVVEYVLQSVHGATRLRLVQSGMPAGDNWDSAYEGTNVGWRMFLAALKYYLETHAGRARHTLARSGSVVGTRDEVWRTLLGASLIGALELSGGAPADATYRATAVTGDELSGRVVLCEPARNLTISVRPFGDGLIQFDVTPGEGRCFVNFILSTFGDRPAHEAIAARWRDPVRALIAGSD